MKGQKEERKLKIQPKSFPRSGKDAIFPEIRVTGKWLQDFGFVCGRYVTIIQKENALVISLLPEAKPQPIPVNKKRKRSSFAPQQTMCTRDDRSTNRQPFCEPAGYVPSPTKSLCQAAES